MRKNLFLIIVGFIFFSKFSFSSGIDEFAEEIAIKLYNNKVVLEEEIKNLYELAKESKSAKLIPNIDYDYWKKQFVELGNENDIINKFIFSFEDLLEKEEDNENKIKSKALSLILYYLNC